MFACDLQAMGIGHVHGKNCTHATDEQVKR
jgi:hypothetical protein